MSISERYRRLLERLDVEADQLYEALPETAVKALRQVDLAVEVLQDWVEMIGEIPQLQLDNKISPVLLKAHGHLDRARVILESENHQPEAVKIWELEQLIYRLLNDL